MELNIAIIIFIILETLNVFILYRAPLSRLGNGVGVFNRLNELEDEPSKMILKYFANWIAGVKMIFILLLLVILVFGDESIKIYSCVVMTFSIATYFWKLRPIINKLDEMGQITPKGYSKILTLMISGFLVMFTATLIVHFLKL